MRFLPKSRRSWAVTILVVVIASAAAWPLIRRVLVRRPTGPYWVELGRGSGMIGLDTVKIREDGAVTLQRPGHPSWATATMKLSDGSLARLRRSVAENRLLGLRRAYHAVGVHDGTQWVLRITQGGEEKTVYFSNLFPDEVVRFADEIDAVLAKDGLGDAEWRSIDPEVGREADDGLWDSIRPWWRMALPAKRERTTEGDDGVRLAHRDRPARDAPCLRHALGQETPAVLGRVLPSDVALVDR
jgi:hypothetical protein